MGILGIMARGSWLVIVIGAAARLALELVRGTMPLQHAIPRSIGHGLGIWLFALAVIWIAALIAKQRDRSVLLRRVWILGMILVALSIIGTWRAGA
jgi:hypothetical protein